MSKEDLMKKFGVSMETLDGVIRSCGYTYVKNFHAVHENVMRSFIKKAEIKVVRKELIELISRAYHKGIEAGKNSILIADKNRLDEIFEEAINK